MRNLRLALVVVASFAAGWMFHTESVKAQGSAIRVIAVPTGTSNPATAQPPGTLVGFSCLPETGSSATCFAATRNPLLLELPRSSNSCATIIPDINAKLRD